MKKASKFAALAAAAALTLTACSTGGSAKSTASGASSDYKACVVSDSGGWDDHSFNEAAYNGLQRAAKKLGVETGTAESNSASDYQPNIDSLVSGGCNLTIGVGFLLAADITQAAQDNSDLNFALVDSAFQDASGKSVSVDNGRALEFNTVEAAYLAGYVAAGMTKTGTVATFGGQQIPTVTIFMDGFVDGVVAYNKAKGTNVKVLGWDKAKQSGAFTQSFEDKSLGKQQAQQFIDQGADIIMPVAGNAALGAGTAAKDSGNAYIIGVDSDWYESAPDYKDIVITSVLKRIDNAVYDTVKAGSEGKLDGTPYIGTLENKGVGLAPYHDFDSKVPQSLKDEVSKLTDQITSGELKITSDAQPQA
ncbi:BMP family lipoprotein [Neoactinobaculum massilliense]|uniref:BMP family lipoprotein n=1 Tax=Neoactinobaculum massilliense TaxID=2364794 RepID=UPI000F52B5CA|nr:BMP family ABC transporter substrate-binding protein [Neoactinobaculum massilliense]